MPTGIAAQAHHISAGLIAVQYIAVAIAFISGSVNGMIYCILGSPFGLAIAFSDYFEKDVRGPIFAFIIALFYNGAKYAFLSLWMMKDPRNFNKKVFFGSAELVYVLTSSMIFIAMLRIGKTF